MNRNFSATRVLFGLFLFGVVGASSLPAGCGSADSATPQSAQSSEPTKVGTADYFHQCPFASSENIDKPLSSDGPKVAVLLVSHGSRSEGWRKMLLDIERSVRDEILKSGRVGEVRSAFMEYAEPSIAAQLKAFDQQGCTDIILVPLLLTVSSHSFDDIPTIIGRKQERLTTDTLRLEGVEIYKPEARVQIAPLLDFAAVLGKNVVRRAWQMSKNPAAEGVVLVAYGDEQYDEQWKRLLKKVGDELRSETGIDCVRHAWCGHIVHHKSEPTATAIREVLKQKQRAIVIPILVSVDETFQGMIIGGAVTSVGADDRIAYRHDAILPDENVNRWIVDISLELASKVTGRHATTKAE